MNAQQKAELRAHLEGEREATIRWDHWHSGIQLVGSCGTTLVEALAPIEAEMSKLDMCDPQRTISIA